MPEQLVFNDSLNLLGSVGTGLTTLGGSVDVTYGASNVATGSLSLTALGLLGAQTYTNLSVTQTGVAIDGTTPIYTLTGSNLLTSVAVTYTGQAPTAMSANVTLLSTGVAVASGSGNVTASVICFVSGTLIRTSRGDLAVEALEIGDLVVTAYDSLRPIKWIGNRTFHAPRLEHCPVRILAGAFGGDLPERDLSLSPGHPVLVEGHLVPIMCLINGTSIARMPIETVTYWHVELDQHDVILAEGLPVESYFDMGTKPWFKGDDSALSDPDLIPLGIAGRCLPVAVSGSVVERGRQKLNDLFAFQLDAQSAWSAVDLSTSC